MRETCVPVHQIYRRTSPQGKTKTGAETLHTNRTKWPREQRHPNDIIRNKDECLEIQHKITQEDVGRARRARELRHSTQINRNEHATIQNGYYYRWLLLRAATTTGDYYYGWLLYRISRGARSRSAILYRISRGSEFGPRVKYTKK